MAKRPNIILMMVDDMGFSDLGCYGGEIDTPNLDRLAKNGMRFTQFYNCAKCAPTRASLLTGLYSQQVGCHSQPVKMENCATIAEVLKGAGYQTYMSGKWHCEEIPTQRGFQRHRGLIGGCGNHFDPGGKRNLGDVYFVSKTYAIDHEVIDAYDPGINDFYSTDTFTDWALAYLDESTKSDDPFLLYIAYTAPHFPLQAWPKDIEKYRGKYRVGWDAIREQRYERLKELGIVKDAWPNSDRYPEVNAWEDDEDKDGWDLRMAVYSAMIDRVDQNVVRILEKLREMGEEDNTLILFLSDNGACSEDFNNTPDIAPGPAESYRTQDTAWANASNTPFRLFKSDDHEGGIATPLIAHWPNVIQPGQMTDAIGHVIDFMATFVDMVEVDYPAEINGQPVFPMEGKSLIPIFEGNAWERGKPLFWSHGSRGAVRDGKWKLVSQKKGPWELYDMDADRTEMSDLSEQRPDIVKNLSGQWKTWAKRVNTKYQGPEEA